MANTHSLDLEASSSQYAYITDANQTGLDITGDFTIEFWLKLETLPPDGTTYFFVTKDDTSTPSRGFGVWMSVLDKKIKCYYFQNNTTITEAAVNTAFTIDDVGVWKHIAVAVDVSAKTFNFYINGSSVSSTLTASNATSVQNSAGDFAIGNVDGQYDTSHNTDGLIDEVRVWNDIRTSTEIADNYKKELVGNEANLQGYWKLNNNYLDETSNNNDLTASGSPVFSIDTPSPFESPSPSLSPSASPSLSPSASQSPSSSPSASQSPSSSPSASQSPSASPSASESRSPSLSPSASQSPSSSISASPSSSPSASESRSPSLSPSASPSSSVSPSPSTGYTDYTRGNYAALPTNDNDLETAYSAGDVTDVSSKNDVYVDQSATNGFMIHQFKEFVGEQVACQVEVEARSTLGCNLSTTYLQIYNHTTGSWVTIDSDNSTAADTDFTLISDVADLTDYKDSSNVISCRVYQEAV